MPWKRCGYLYLHWRSVALAFVGISWATKGFPLMGVRAVAMKPDARVPTFEESVQQGIRKDWESQKTSQSDGKTERDRYGLRSAGKPRSATRCRPADKSREEEPGRGKWDQVVKAAGVTLN